MAQLLEEKYNIEPRFTMSLTPLTDRREIQSAVRRTKHNLKQHSVRFSRKVGWHGGGGMFEICWRPAEELWFFLDENREPNRYWMSFGTQDPSESHNLSITAEINPTKEGINRTIAGVFVRDTSGTVYLAHTGKIGGGRKGIGRNSFIAQYTEVNLMPLDWPDGKITDAIIIGPIDSQRLASQIAHFIRVIEAYKSRFADREETSPQDDDLSFNPEFSGPRRGYRVGHEISSRCDHGLVVDALREALETSGFRIGNTRSCDLLLAKSKGRVTHLFEVKTDCSTTSFYTAIGQLMIHGHNRSRLPKLVAVMPGEASERWRQAMGRLAVRTVSYTWQGGKPVFRGLEEALR